MYTINFRRILLLTVLAGFFSLAVSAEDRRVIPMDMYLIIDGSAFPGDSKGDAVAWINAQIVDRILMDGDRISIWTAGEKALLIFSETVSGTATKQAIKEKLQSLDTSGKTADFSGALREAGSGISPNQDQSRLSYTMLITGEAGGLEPTLTGSAGNLLRWSRSEKYERWQVLVAAPGIGGKVQAAAAAYMSSIR